MRFPSRHLGHQLRSPWVAGGQSRRIARLGAERFGLLLFRVSVVGKEYLPEPVIIKPVLTEKLAVRGRIRGFPACVRVEKVADKLQVVGESLVSVKVHLPVCGRTDGGGSDQLLEILFQIGAGEYLDHVERELLKFSAALAAQVPARQFVRPGGVLEALHGFTVDAFDLRAETVLIQKCSQALV